MKYCKLTGAEIPEGGFAANEAPIKKMCLNCKSLVENEDGTFACRNENVMESGRAKILAAIPEGFEIETLTLKPMVLKNPTKKCANHETDFETIDALVRVYLH